MRDERASERGSAGHRLVDSALKVTENGIVGYCTCGWHTGPRISSFAASVAFRDHQEDPRG